MVAEARVKKEELAKERAAAEAQLDGLEKVDITRDGGIVKHIIQAGQGPPPSDGAQIKAHYTGRLLDGTVFDSSVERNTPFDFALGRGSVIKCWDQGFATMQKGRYIRFPWSAKSFFFVVVEKNGHLNKQGVTIAIVL